MTIAPFPSPREVGVRPMNWHVYVILCSDGSLYTGITTDLERRFLQHATGRGARYFRGRSPSRLMYAETGHDRSSATRREMEIKRMTCAEKWAMIQGDGGPPAGRDSDRLRG